ncbi:hypothetical protein L1987_46999 [Smallanthus sonchifolius]|uniref:Uncharacterized protein n=1 Tax=Smallanthus sonchifolius TaxID=185202 RepID=A0ACB9G1C1_9ASTR|nr:hypothetical protein L1987_46999 [Smallanthus sonchifolius]
MVVRPLDPHKDPYRPQEEDEEVLGPEGSIKELRKQQIVFVFTFTLCLNSHHTELTSENTKTLLDVWTKCRRHPHRSQTRERKKEVNFCVCNLIDIAYEFNLGVTTAQQVHDCFLRRVYRCSSKISSVLFYTDLLSDFHLRYRVSLLLIQDLLHVNVQVLRVLSKRLEYV